MAPLGYALRFAWVFALLALPLVCEAEEPQKVSFCELKSDPAKYNHKLIEVKTYVLHGFEEFKLADGACESGTGVWVEYGGNTASPTVYCCGSTAGKKSPEPIRIDNIAVPLLRDAQFKKFDRLIQKDKKEKQTTLYATLVGRFFAGSVEDDFKLFSGYGHFGCCRLFVIQVLSPWMSRIKLTTPLPYTSLVPSCTHPLSPTTGAIAMRMLVNVEMPLEPFNTYVKDGSIAEKMHKILGFVKPEAAYFSERNGHRGATLIIDVKEPSDIPSLAEPFFLTLNAQVSFHICMTPEDLGKAKLGDIGKMWA